MWSHSAQSYGVHTADLCRFFAAGHRVFLGSFSPSETLQWSSVDGGGLGWDPRVSPDATR